jgi:hypothetical protein
VSRKEKLRGDDLRTDRAAEVVLHCRIEQTLLLTVDRILPGMDASAKPHRRLQGLVFCFCH